MHTNVMEFCVAMKQNNPDRFNNKTVLDVGCLDINGNNRYLFDNCDYYGIDIIKGPNVDEVIRVEEYDKGYDFIISTEMLEHNKTRKDALIQIYKNAGESILITCATTGRPEHGTSRTTPADSPATNDYYLNISEEMFRSVYKEDMFDRYTLIIRNYDLMFYGIKGI